MLVFGRTAMGENLRTGLVRDVWEITQGEKLLWADALHLSGDLQGPLNHPAGFGGARAVATSVLVVDDVGVHLGFVGDHLGGVQNVVKFVSAIVGGVLVTLWMAFDTQTLRTVFCAYLAAMRNRVKCLPEALPRLWHM